MTRKGFASEYYPEKKAIAEWLAKKPKEDLIDEIIRHDRLLNQVDINILQPIHELYCFFEETNNKALLDVLAILDERAKNAISDRMLDLEGWRQVEMEEAEEATSE